MRTERTHAVSVFQTISAKSLPPIAVHSPTSVTFNGKELVRYDYGSAPLDANGNPMELHHHVLQRLGLADRHSPFNLREVTREQHAALGPYRNLGD